MKKLIMIFLAIGSLIIFSSTSLLCADDVGRDFGPEWGGTDFVSYAKHHSEFTGVDSTNDSLIRSYDADDWGLIYRYCANDCTLSTGLQLPQGARIIGWRLDADVTEDGKEVILALQSCPFNSSYCSDIATRIKTTGTGWKHITQSCSHTVDNYNHYYRFLVLLPATWKFEGSMFGGFLNGGVVFYKLQISPAPATATFNDVGPGHWAFQSVEALAASGITQGCPDGPNLYCPDKPVSRAAMAVFLARALGLHWGY